MWEFDLQLDENEAIKDLGLDDTGVVQRKVDSTFIHYIRLKMPFDSGMMMANTRATTPGEVIVDVPYAHYMNTGLLYVNPTYGRSGFPIYKKGVLVGFKGYKGKRVPTTRYLNYHSGPGRGAFFVERTILENTNDIVKVAERSVKGD